VLKYFPAKQEQDYSCGDSSGFTPDSLLIPHGNQYGTKIHFLVNSKKYSVKYFSNR